MADMYLKAKMTESYLIKIRRELHANAELGFKEYKTSKIIQRELKDMGVPYRVIGTGVVGLIKGKAKGKTIAIRADIDALPVCEETGLSFSSRNKNVMHACGHDAHTACVLGAAKLLSNMKDTIKGSIKILFQPAEEKAHPTKDGATEMIKAGAMKNPRPDAVIALHVDTPGEAGKISVTYGPVFANADFFEIIVHGRGGHGAEPHKAIDPVNVASAIILNLQSIVSKSISPLDSAVITIGAINAGKTLNVIPSFVNMKGTTRSLNEKDRKIIKSGMKNIIEKTAKAFGARAELHYQEGYPGFSNDDKLIKLMEKTGIRLFGKKKVVFEKNATMCGENFSYFTKLAPGALIRLGAGNKKKGISSPLHHPKFTIDETALPVGASVLAESCLEFLTGC